MAQQTINVGTAPNDGTGTPLRTAFQYTNSNFSELYTAVGPSGNNIVVPGNATITGDLTVDTSTLKVDSANNRVGIGTASPATILDIQSAGSVFARIQNTASSADAYLLVKNGAGEGFFGINATGPYIYTAQSLPITFTTATLERYRIASDGIATWSNVGGVAGTAMVLNSSGVGIGSVNSLSGGSRKCLTINSGAGQLSILELAVNGTMTGYLFSNASQTSLVSQGATYITFDTNSNERMRIDSSGNVGIGVTPSAWGGSYKALQLQSVARNIAATGAGSGDFTVAFNAIYDSTDSRWEYAGTGDKAGRYSQTGSGNHRWFVSNTAGTAGNEITDFASPAMTLDASGNLLVGTTSNAPGGTQSQFVNEWSGAIKWGSTFNQTVSSATPYTHIAFCTNGTVRGSIDANNTTITYGTVSDYRLKDNVQPLSGGLARINALKPSTYKWKESQSDSEGFIAHELASVVPLAVIGEKDAVNEDGSIKPQQVDLSKVVPVLVAAIQELAAEVNALKNA